MTDKKQDFSVIKGVILCVQSLPVAIFCDTDFFAWSVIIPTTLFVTASIYTYKTHPVRTMDVVTNGCNGTHDHDDDAERTGKPNNVRLNTLPHSTNNNVEKTLESVNNGGSIKKSIISARPKRTKKCVAILDDNRYAIRIENMVEEHLKFGRFGNSRSN